MSVVLDPLLDWAENEWDSMSEQEKQEMEKEVEDEDGDPLLFLPFPFTTKEVHQRPYKGSDPEWKAFVKVNKDANLQKQMKRKQPWDPRNGHVVKRKQECAYEKQGN